MAIDTTNKKLALLHWMRTWEHPLPTAPGSLGQDDQQQLLWGYPGVLWQTGVIVTPPPDHYGDLTTLFVDYCEDLRDLNLLEDDTTTLVCLDQPHVRGATHSLDDLNTAYAEYLTI